MKIKNARPGHLAGFGGIVSSPTKDLVITRIIEVDG
jgi:hypothetical protein